jgi:hypothetical protein
MITAYQAKSPMLKRYIELNGIVSAFVFKEGEREWQVYAGNAVTRVGIKEGSPFKTMREALAHAEKVNALIVSVESKNMTLDKFAAMYLDWANNFLTVPAFADHYGITVESAEQLIALGRAVMNLKLVEGN